MPGLPLLLTTHPSPDIFYNEVQLRRNEENYGHKLHTMYSMQNSLLIVTGTYPHRLNNIFVLCVNAQC